MRIQFFLLLLLVLNLQQVHAEKRYIELPDGSYFEIRKDERPEDAILEAARKYPEAFVIKKIPDSKKYDVDFFNSCKLSAAKSTVSQAAMISAIQACQYKAIPKKCRALSITTDRHGNETGADRVKCVEQCNNANAYSKSLGECSKG